MVLYTSLFDSDQFSQCPKKTDIDRDRLSKLLGMLGSAHDGEIANAGRAAHALIRAAGSTWPDVLRSADVDELDRLRSVNARLRLEVEVLDSTVARLRSDNIRVRQEKLDAERLRSENAELRLENEVLRLLDAAGLGDKNAKLQHKNAKLKQENEVLLSLNEPPPWHEPEDEDEQIAACVAWRAFLDPDDRKFVLALLNRRARNHGQHQAYRLFQLTNTIRMIARRVGRMAA